MRSLSRVVSRVLKLNPLPLGWLRDTRRMRKLVAAFTAKHTQERDATRFAVVVVPWCGTPVPWFSLVCGLFLATNGNKVTFIFDDMPFGDESVAFRFQVGCIRSVLRVLGDRHDVVTLSDWASDAPLDRAARQLVDRLAELNAVWALRGELQTSGRKRQVERATRQLRASYAAIAAVQLRGRYDVLFVPGGVWGSSGIWVDRARAAEVRVASYDSGAYQNLLIAVDGIACQLQDIPRAFALLKNRSMTHREHEAIVESTLAEIARRRSGIDKFSSQMRGMQASDGRFAGAMLVALNSSWDSAALGLHTVFDSNAQWIVETTKYLLENTAAQVVVRQHPVERLDVASTTDDYRSLLTQHFGDHPRLRFIAAEEPVNSYELLEQVAAVVVHTSTIGTEAAAHGKVVVTASRSYYANLGFVWRATSLEQYRQYLSDAAAGRYVVTPAMRDDALRCYYLTQCCNWVFTPFTPSTFTEWSRHGLEEVRGQENVSAVITALEKNIPVAFLNHLARQEHQPA
jgi:hypothetical protein